MFPAQAAPLLSPQKTKALHTTTAAAAAPIRSVGAKITPPLLLLSSSSSSSFSFSFPFSSSLSRAEEKKEKKKSHFTHHERGKIKITLTRVFFFAFFGSFFFLCVFCSPGSENSLHSFLSIFFNDQICLLRDC